MAKKEPLAVSFDGFPDTALKFLTALGFHQNREWFHENKKLYQSAVKDPMGDLVEAASVEFSKLSIPLKGDRKSSLFRVNRDVRFSKNKDPYNTHASAVLTRNGTKKDGSGVYMHFKPDNCLFAAGIWFPQTAELRALREAIIARKQEFLAIEQQLKKQKLVFGTDSNLKRVPPAFKHIDDPELQRLLKHKSFVIEMALSDTEIESPKLLKTFTKLTKQAMPLLEFGWRAMDPARDTNEA